MPVTDQNSAKERAASAALRSLALKAKGLSGADIERLVREARQKARRQDRALAFSDLHDILASARPERSDALRWRMALHESGHAVARLVLGLGRIASISIDSPGGGYTEGELTSMEAETEEFFSGRLIISLAGRAVEEELLGSVTAGSGGSPTSDLAKSTELALAMEAALGFARDAPLLYRSTEEPVSLLAYNPLLANRVNERLDGAYTKARDLVSRNRDAVRFLAEALMQHDTLEGPELAAVIETLSKRLARPPAPG